jgi:signal transduction histidine kinase
MTTRNQLERLALERSQSVQLRDTLLTGLTHDLRGPLTVIRIEARLLHRGLAPRYLDTVQNIERMAIRMTGLIDGVDFLMRTSTGVGMRLEHSPSIQIGDALLTGLTNDLRDPLTAMRSETRLLRRDINASYYLESLDAIERSATRMTSWIDDVLDTVSVQNGQEPPLVLAPADLVELVRDAIDEYHNARRHRLVLDARATSIAGQFDAPRMERALDNLVGNAIKYSPDGGDIRLEVSAGTDWAKVVVHDQGIGIPAKDLPHVFEPFRRGGNVVGRIRGKGIGLANARHIVEQHGGALSVESALGHGSTFIVRLPRQPAPALS